MSVDFDVIVIGGGPAGLYSGLVLKKGLPTQRKSEDIKVAIFEKGKIGGLAKFGFITFSERWAFSGSKIVSTFYKECIDAGVDIIDQTTVTSVSYDEANEIVYVEANNKKYTCNYVIITSGIFPNPDALAHKNVLLALHTPSKMLNDVYRKGWKNVILYGTDYKTLEALKSDLSQIDNELTFGIKTQEINQNNDILPGISEETWNEWDGVLIDYNSYKVIAGSIELINIPESVKIEKGYILTNHFGKTGCDRIYAAGNVANVISGVLIALSSALTASLTVGRMINPSVISEPTGRFPWYPRELSWENSWLPFLDDLGHLESFNNEGKYENTNVK